jgi:hypothetical protein
MIPKYFRRSRKVLPKQIRTLHRVRSETAGHLICDYLEGLNCPRALTSWMLYKYGEHHQLVHLQCEPNQYLNTEEFRAAHAASKFLSKCVGLSTNINLKEVALESAEEAETMCRSTNLTIRAIRDGHASDLYGPEIFRAIQIISKILGPCPSSFEDAGWSVGRTSAVHGDMVTGYHKYQGRLDVTVRSRSRALQLLNGSPWWGASALQADAPVSVLPRALTTIGGNTLITVPKSAKTDRTICYEPHMNIRLQLAAGSYLRSRLRRAGVNLDDQSINRRRARLGSKYGQLATIDLKSASDTVSLELVYELLPIDWACLLDDLRSPCTLWPDGSWRKCEKFSSMGNGFTFELESLLFYALASAVSENVSVYGDDIIVPSSSFERVTHLLMACGFQPNLRKSFSSGCFRESCGGDYFSGFDCTPVYLRSLPKTIGDVLKLHNQVYRFASVSRERKWADIMRKWRTIYPASLGPSGFGDGHYHTNFDEACPRAAISWDVSTQRFSNAYTGIEGFIFRTTVPSMKADVELTCYASALCVGTGPKRAFNLLSSANRHRVRYREIWGLANVWPSVDWV